MRQGRQTITEPTPAEKAREAAKTLEDPDKAHQAARDKMMAMAQAEEEQKKKEKREQFEKRRKDGFVAEAQGPSAFELKKKREEEVNAVEAHGHARGGVMPFGRDEFKQQAMTEGAHLEADRKRREANERKRKENAELMDFEAEREAQLEAAAAARAKQMEAARKRIADQKAEEERKRQRFSLVKVGSTNEEATQKPDKSSSTADAPKEAEKTETPATKNSGLGSLGNYDSGSEDEEESEESE
eukprot:TRINITY_DN41631_c0_g1_i1.p1 TRINITY_DN41631_c0_g1~~TRINITY_DN41631_c0_g1_i1.p1  ORF type:complete len:243 (+),score=98.61 TRINITY_DN41631_c0_g1_i1:105-833(+)